MKKKTRVKTRVRTITKYVNVEPKPRVAIYPGSFNPIHKGHIDVLRKALGVFDKVIVAFGDNASKAPRMDANTPADDTHTKIVKMLGDKRLSNRIEVIYFKGLLAELVSRKKAVAVVKGLRNSKDLEDERDQQYYNTKDLGMKVPTAYFICDNENISVSSTAIRSIRKIGRE
jgi:pantetheine-phosphate adenylyltransferase